MSRNEYHPGLANLRAAVTEIYGERVERIVLFGSRARGDAHGDSDYDVAVFLRDVGDRFAEMHRLADLSTPCSTRPANLSMPCPNEQAPTAI
jgi:predicted nucleotidyltransferase